MAVKTPLAIKQQPYAHRGLEQRNVRLDIVEQIGKEGVVYFMDDDNAYDVQLFHELAYTTHVSVFGTGLSGGGAYERCHVDPQTGKVNRLLSAWQASRTFAVDMAGFAFATHPLARHRATGTPMRCASPMGPHRDLWKMISCRWPPKPCPNWNLWRPIVRGYWHGRSKPKAVISITIRKLTRVQSALKS